MHSLPLKLPPGSDLRGSVEHTARQSNVSGFILGVVGNLDRAAFQCPGSSKPTVIEGNLEIITLNGTFSPEGVHLHLSLSDGDCQVWGGHLELGTLVKKGADILLGIVDQSKQNAHHPSAPSSVSAEPRVEIAVLYGCTWSARAIRMQRTLEVPYRLQTINSDSAFTSLKKRSDMSTFPQIFVDGELLGGYEALAELNGSGKLEDLR